MLTLCLVDGRLVDRKRNELLFLIIVNCYSFPLSFSSKLVGKEKGSGM